MAIRDNIEASRYLPDDIIDDILIRLPVKDLLRYKCVCTRWCLLVSSPCFVSLHLEHSMSNPSKEVILVRHRYEERPILHNPFNSVLYWLRFHEILVGSINGLVGVVGGSHEAYDIWIWNPATRMSKKLPLGIHNADLRVTFGFGWDPNANVYKLVKFVYCGGAAFGEVWSSDLDSWREVGVTNEFLHLPSPMTSSDVTVKGGLVVYWLVSNTIDPELVEDGHDVEIAVASFDMSTEVLQIIPLPELHVSYNQLEDDISNLNGVFGINWKENFALVERYTSDIPERYFIWTLDIREKCWIMEVSFDLNVFSLGCLDSCNEKLVLIASRRLMLCDIKAGLLHFIGYSTIGGDYVGEARFFLESLVSLEGFVSCIEEWTI